MKVVTKQVLIPRSISIRVVFYESLNNYNKVAGAHDFVCMEYGFGEWFMFYQRIHFFFIICHPLLPDSMYIHSSGYVHLFLFIQSHLEHKKHQTKCLISGYFTNLFVTLCQVTVLFLFVFVSVFLFSSMDTKSFIQLFNKF